ncbi:Uncharacterised protein [Vibrio cholerae]|nr:Uncharacterised protein [Vibrio cholerae]
MGVINVCQRDRRWLIFSSHRHTSSLFSTPILARRS